ncbi:hypothetical protein K488DRAFT_71443 [Vararia minispora EC-137]|uniref:Uncharacterized protein n=1 Tax=Vararia minispora EC-137 TaxID=1314806 RepID=A0ACB8QID7_9AGAM|nr:hypothetical protein K488DRAFT_71443 [Vararia minispora EC-137]
MQLTSLVAFTLAAVGAVTAVPSIVKRVTPLPSTTYIRAFGRNDTAYLTFTGFAYEFFPENEGQEAPAPGLFTVTSADAPAGNDGDTAYVQLTSSSGIPCSTDPGYLACFDASYTPATFFAQIEGTTWYLQQYWAVADAHPDDPRDGYLHLFNSSSSAPSDARFVNVIFSSS